MCRCVCIISECVVCCVNCALSACGQRPKQSSLILADKTQRDPDYKLAPHTHRPTHTLTDMHTLGSSRTRQIPRSFLPFSSSEAQFLSLLSLMFSMFIQPRVNNCVSTFTSFSRFQMKWETEAKHFLSFTSLFSMILSTRLTSTCLDYMAAINLKQNSHLPHTRSIFQQSAHRQSDHLFFKLSCCVDDLNDFTRLKWLNKHLILESLIPLICVSKQGTFLPNMSSFLFLGKIGNSGGSIGNVNYRFFLLIGSCTWCDGTSTRVWRKLFCKSCHKLG